GCRVDELRVDGGMAENDWFLQFLADITNRPVEKPEYPEMTALGAAVLAAGELGWMTLDEWHEHRRIAARFEPKMDADKRQRNLDGWKTALSGAINH
ncbi:MAG TPA: glycerol kinase, partial [Hyphomonadaceae bacterium]|nr:glycerol kinase [Hyphomonadaceae bacterium]